jgi:hypothetical protein
MERATKKPPKGHWIDTGLKDYPGIFVPTDLPQEEFKRLWQAWVDKWGLKEPLLFVQEKVTPGKSKLHSFHDFLKQHSNGNGR